MIKGTRRIQRSLRLMIPYLEGKGSKGKGREASDGRHPKGALTVGFPLPTGSLSLMHNHRLRQLQRLGLKKVQRFNVF